MNDDPGTPSGLTALANGKLKPYLVSQLCFGNVGCAYRGTVTCTRCPYADRIPKLCEWRCHECNDRWRCFCGQTGQEIRVDMAMASTALDNQDDALVVGGSVFTARAHAVSCPATTTENVGVGADGNAGQDT